MAEDGDGGGGYGDGVCVCEAVVVDLLSRCQYMHTMLRGIVYSVWQLRIHTCSRSSVGIANIKALSMKFEVIMSMAKS